MELLIPLLIFTGLLALILIILLIILAIKPEQKRPSRRVREDIQKIKKKISDSEIE